MNQIAHKNEQVYKEGFRFPQKKLLFISVELHNIQRYTIISSFSYTAYVVHKLNIQMRHWVKAVTGGSKGLDSSKQFLNVNQIFLL